MTRRELLALMGAAPLRDRLPASVPPAVAAILENTLRSDPGSLNTDWFGTLLMKGVLEWGRRGVAESRAFAEAWLGHHLASGKLASYSGNRSRRVMAAGVEITTYCGHFGLAFPCYEMAAQYGDERAKRIVAAVADIILHRTARNRFGMVGHDDTADFAIPDTTYFVVSPLMLAAVLDPARADVYREQAHYQLRTSIDTFLARDTGLAKTVLLKDGIGKTYWTRASGWLLWAMGGMLRHLPENDPRHRGYVDDMRRLVEGVMRVQDAGGGFHVHMDDPRTPLETTGAAMFAMGAHEGVRRGWLPGSVIPAVDRAWKFVTANITPEGKIRRAYTGWAIPAERGEMTMDHVEMGWIPGFILSAACEMTS